MCVCVVLYWGVVCGKVCGITRCKICAHLVIKLLKSNMHILCSFRLKKVYVCIYLEDFTNSVLLCIVSRLYLGAIVGVLMEGKRIWCTLCVFNLMLMET